MREVRLERDQAKAKEAALHRRNDTAVLQTILGDDGDKPVRKEDDVLASFGISCKLMLSIQCHADAQRTSTTRRSEIRQRKERSMSLA